MSALLGFVEHDFPTDRELQAVRDIAQEVGIGEFLPQDVAGPLRILRYLRGQSGDKTKAADMFKEMLEWRAHEMRYRVDDLRASVAGLTLEEYQKVFAAKPERPYLPGAFLGRSRQGAVVALYKAGAWDCDGLMEKYGEHAVVRHETEKMEWVMWYFQKCSEEERRIPYLLVILDLEGASRKQLQGRQRKILMECAKELSRYYNDAVELTLVINAPLIFRAAWALISPWLTKRQQAKCRVLGAMTEENLEALRATVAPEFLPAELGGTATPDIWGEQAQRFAASNSASSHRRNPAHSGDASRICRLSCCCWPRSRDDVDYPAYPCGSQEQPLQKVHSMGHHNFQKSAAASSRRPSLSISLWIIGFSLLLAILRHSYAGSWSSHH